MKMTVKLSDEIYSRDEGVKDSQHGKDAPPPSISYATASLLSFWNKNSKKIS